MILHAQIPNPPDKTRVCWGKTAQLLLGSTAATLTSEMHQRFWRDLPGKRFPTSYFITKKQQKLNEVVFNVAVMYKLTVHNGWHSDFPLIHEIPNFYPFSKPQLLFLNPKFSIIICPVARANDVWHILHSCHEILTINVLILLGQASL